uniref:Uma2 family endonuclease n=1 Tax=Herbidospora sakaeratensis TaxID=564415 RepID=UPI000B1D586F|nr:Uma2 family endonuclease [Herbidospora sakaeratensis]
MTVAYDGQDYAFDRGPYEVADLDRMPRDARYELLKGWILMSPWPIVPHETVAENLRDLLRSAINTAAADLVVRGPTDVLTEHGLLIPDVAVIDQTAVERSTRQMGRGHEARDVRLVVEIVSRGSGSERTDWYEKFDEYAASGIPEYWIVEFEPALCITRNKLVSGHRTYERVERVFARHLFESEAPVPIEFDPAVLFEVTS